jgi:hypothetical protein
MREIKLGQRTVKVRKMTVREVDDFLGDTTVYPPTMAELLLERTLPERAVRLVTDLTTEELNGEVDPDELDCLWQAVEDENHFLSRMHRKLMKISVEMLAEERQEPPASSELPADSPAADTPE